MRKLLIAGALAALPFSALAADLPVRSAAPAPAPMMVAAHTWTGFYLGAFAGWNRQDAEISANDVIFNTVAVATSPSTGNLKNNALSGGVFAGYQVQLDRVVFGAEVDVAYINSDFGRTFNFPGAGSSAATSTIVNFNSDFAATLRVRAGLLLTDNLLAYGIAGIAFKSGDVSVNTTNACCSGAYSWKGSENKVQTGYVVGVGAELNVTQNWNLRLEYLFVGMPDFDFNASASTNTQKFTVKSSEQQARVGISYRFGGSSAPVVARY